MRLIRFFFLKQEILVLLGNHQSYHFKLGATSKYAHPIGIYIVMSLLRRHTVVFFRSNMCSAVKKRTALQSRHTLSGP